MKHTKGPWKFEQHDGNYEIWSQNVKIAIVNEAHEIEQPIGTDLCNSYLIAAAPEMLEALENLVERDLIKDKDNDHYSEVIELIKKARGDS